MSNESGRERIEMLGRAGPLSSLLLGTALLGFLAQNRDDGLAKKLDTKVKFDNGGGCDPDGVDAGMIFRNDSDIRQSDTVASLCDSVLAHVSAVELIGVDDPSIAEEAVRVASMSEMEREGIRSDCLEAVTRAKVAAREACETRRTLQPTQCVSGQNGKIRCYRSGTRGK